MENIIVVDCISTGVNFIEDIINRGYNPIVLELKPSEDIVDKYNQKIISNYNRINEKFDMIYEKDTYEETLEAVRKVNPLLVVPGCEEGVVLATKLSDDLNLLGNSAENIGAMTLKHEMHKRLAENGLRYIKGKIIKSVDEAIDFCDDESLNEVVVKPIRSAGSCNVRVCLNKQEMVDTIEELMGSTGYYGGNVQELLIQERIDGDEYIVNTVSNDGWHRVTTIWKYSKVKTSEGAMIYDTIETVNTLGISEAEMVEYAYKVADAIGIKYGPIHGEYMIDKDGPVLIEVNCRPCGGNMPAKFLDEISGQHETDSILDSYLKPVRFRQKALQRYGLQGHGALKVFIVPEDIVARSAPMADISPNLKSYFKADFDEMAEDGVFYIKTEDFHSTCGIIYLVHKNNDVLQEDINFLRSLEKYAFALVVSPELEKIEELDEDKLVSHLTEVVDNVSEYGTGLLITDQFLDTHSIVQVGVDDISNINEEFDYVIINLNKSLVEKKDYLVVELILDILERIKVGGIVFIPETTYKYYPGQRKGIEALMIVLDLRIEVPPYGVETGVIASKDLIG
ncbi:ATP-grasp domain-containing protein [uncultured Methanobrevibacter sp.]|uniref:ATP-grasp domain-containing protein n=1 Tax=uncultured Methanobrevibacter sp. TaxID=253161 RepID=UPI0025D264E2|nr:ATP-grasp domain-containing protein [uncultured Methanobrevibacter sp.]